MANSGYFVRALNDTVRLKSTGDHNDRQDLLTLIGLVLQVVGWDPAGRVELNSIVCSNNAAGERGGCFHSSGGVVITNGTVMQDNQADESGGGVCECKIDVLASCVGNKRSFTWEVYSDDQCTLRRARY